MNVNLPSWSVAPMPSAQALATSMSRKNLRRHNLAGWKQRPESRIVGRVAEGIGDHHPQARKQVRGFLGPQFTVLEIQDNVPEVGDVGLAPVRPRRPVRIEYGRAEQKVLALGIRPTLMTLAEKANEGLDFAGYIAEGD